MKYFLILLLAYSNAVYAQIITTIAGDGTSGYSGDGGPATLATLKYPSLMAIDAAGGVYFAEGLNNIIRKVSTSGIISTVAGNGIAGYSGDGGSATAAQLNGPVAVAIDSSGNIYISDEGNNRIRKVDIMTGNISTFAGNGTAGFSGDSDLAISASLNYPIGIACDKNGNVFIGDHVNFRVRKVNASGIISTYAGNGINGFSGDGGPATEAEMNGPNGLSCDSSGNLYICEARVRKVNAITHEIITVAGNGVYGYSGDGGLATSAELALPYAASADIIGNIYISDEDNNRIRKVDTLGIIQTVIGTGVAGFSGDGGAAIDAKIYYPEGSVFDKCGNMFFADEANNRIRKVTFNTSGTPSVVVSSLPGDTVCAGTAVTYTANVTGSSTYAYKWLVNGSVLSTTGSSYTYSPANGDSIRCVFTGTGQCSGDADTVSSNTVHMVVNPLTMPAITLTGSVTATPGSTVMVNATVTDAGSSYIIKWYDDGVLFATTTTPMATYTATAGVDSITAVIIPTGGCYDSATSAVHIVNVINEGVINVAAQQVSIYPNPAHNDLSLTLPIAIGTKVAGNVTVSNLIGQQLLYQDVHSVRTVLDISSLPVGVYLLTVTGMDGGKVVRTIVKE